MSSNQEQLGTLLHLVGYRHEFHPVLVEANNVMSTPRLLDLLIGEIDELAFEHEGWRQHNETLQQETKVPKLLMLEFIDVNVFLGMIIDRLMPSFSIEDINSRVNGQFSGNFNSLTEQAFSLADGNIEHNLTLFVTELLSLLKHVDVELQANFYAKLMNAKLAANKEARFYQKEPGMSEEDVLAKYEHVTAALRVLRNFFRKATGRDQVLQTWMTDFFAEEILDWRNSKSAMVVLQQKIPLFIQKIKDEAVWKKTANFKDPSFEIKMLLSGAKLVDTPPEMLNEASLQTSSANATLGTDCFLGLI